MLLHLCHTFWLMHISTLLSGSEDRNKQGVRVGVSKFLWYRCPGNTTSPPFSVPISTSHPSNHAKSMRNSNNVHSVTLPFIQPPSSQQYSKVKEGIALIRLLWCLKIFKDNKCPFLQFCNKHILMWAKTRHRKWLKAMVITTPCTWLLGYIYQ